MFSSDVLSEGSKQKCCSHHCSLVLSIEPSGNYKSRISFIMSYNKEIQQILILTSLQASVTCQLFTLLLIQICVSS